jgi:hypothetical protein
MSGKKLILLLALNAFGLSFLQADDEWLTYRGKRGPGKGKQIVFITGDEEYRSEESMPAMARILSARHGFTCTVHEQDGRVGGRYKMSFTNFTTGGGHAFGGEYLALEPGAELSWVFVPIKPGTYQLLCPVNGHVEAGMVGILRIV